MNNSFEQTPQVGWHVETDKHRESIVAFLGKGQQGYDSLSELHYSGGSVFTVEKVKNGTASIITADMFYEGGEPNQLHIVFDGKNNGGNLDVYLTGRALKDYLETL